MKFSNILSIVLAAVVLTSIPACGRKESKTVTTTKVEARPEAEKLPPVDYRRSVEQIEFKANNGQPDLKVKYGDPMPVQEKEGFFTRINPWKD